MTRYASQVLAIMRRAIGRRNENDPDSNDTILMEYINDYKSLSMSDDVKLFEQFGTLTFTIDESNTTGVYTFNDLGASDDFINLSQEAYISLLDPVNNSVSWNQLPIYQNPGEFFAIWGINNDEILIPGYPTNLLFYGNELTFRTIPNTSYMVKIFGYKKSPEFSSIVDPLEFDRWLRFLAYGAAVNYATDFRYEPKSLALIEKGFAREKKRMLLHSHNQIKMARSCPKF